MKQVKNKISNNPIRQQICRQISTKVGNKAWLQVEDKIHNQIWGLVFNRLESIKKESFYE